MRRAFLAAAVAAAVSVLTVPASAALVSYCHEEEGLGVKVEVGGEERGICLFEVYDAVEDLIDATDS